jgi:hypothetical protein
MKKTPVATAMLALLAIALAAPASADPTMSGRYTVHYTESGGADSTFTATPCGAGCTQVAWPNIAGQANLVGNQWRLDLPVVPDAWKCATDGSLHAGRSHMSWDTTTLAGTEVVTHTEAACGFDVGSNGNPHPFTLTKVG